MCLIAPQQNHTDSPICYTGGSPPLGSLRSARYASPLSVTPRGGSLKDVALFQFTETFLHSLLWLRGTALDGNGVVNHRINVSVPLANLS